LFANKKSTIYLNYLKSAFFRKERANKKLLITLPLLLSALGGIYVSKDTLSVLIPLIEIFSLGL